MNTPASLQYSEEHLWVEQTEDGQWKAGITDYAQDLLGDLVYLEQPKVGDLISQGAVCGLVESVKTGSDLHAPLSGEVTEVNEDLEGAPEDINDDPYAAWIFKFSASDVDTEASQLLSAEAYQALIDEA